MNIAVTQRNIYLSSREESCDCLDKRITFFLDACGFASVPIPTVTPNMAKWLKSTRIDGILLTGGNDLVCVGADDVSPARDDLEHQLLDFARERQIPVFGICRGLQIMARHYGAGIVPVENHAGTYHAVQGVWGCIQVNSFHNFGVLAHSLPSSVRVLAQADDGTPESLCIQDCAQLAVMWHPERSHPFRGGDISLVKSFFSSAGTCLNAYA